MIKNFILVIGLIFICFASSLAQEVKLISKTMSECQGIVNRHTEEFYTNVQHLDSGLITIDFSLVGNCAMTDSLTFNFKNDTLTLGYDYPRPPRFDTVWNDEPTEPPVEEFYKIDEETGDSIFDISYTEPYIIIETIHEYALCSCCYCFNLVFSGLDSTDLIVMGKRRELPYFPEGFRVVPIKFDIVDRDTINYSDRYGRRQGTWVKILEWNHTKTVSQHLNNECIGSIEYEYREDGTLKRELHKNDWYHIYLQIDYDKNEKEISRTEYEVPVTFIND